MKRQEQELLILRAKYLTTGINGIKWFDASSCWIFLKDQPGLLFVYFCSFFIKWAIPGLFFVFQQLTVNTFIIKFRRWLDSNRGPLALEATVLPTEPQPPPIISVLLKDKFSEKRLQRDLNLDCRSRSQAPNLVLKCTLSLWVNLIKMGTPLSSFFVRFNKNELRRIKIDNQICQDETDRWCPSDPNCT